MERYMGIMDQQTQHTKESDFFQIYLLVELNSYQNIGKFPCRHRQVSSEFVWQGEETRIGEIIQKNIK